MRAVLVQGWRLQLHRLSRLVLSWPPLRTLAAVAIVVSLLSASIALSRISRREAAFMQANDQLFAPDAVDAFRELSHDLLQQSLTCAAYDDRTDALARLAVLKRAAWSQLDALRRRTMLSNVGIDSSLRRIAMLEYSAERAVDCAERVLRAPPDATVLRYLELMSLVTATGNLENAVTDWIDQKQAGERHAASTQFFHASPTSVVVLAMSASFVALILLFVPAHAAVGSTTSETDDHICGLDHHVLEEVLQHSVLGIHVVDELGQIVWSNDAESRLLGYEPGEMHGRSFLDFHADAEVGQRIFQRLLRGESLQSEPARLLAKDGSIRQVLVDSNAHFENGILKHTRCFTRDVTGQVRIEEAWRASERRLKRLIDRLPVGMFLADERGRCTFLNESWSRLSGMSSALGVEQGWADALHPDDRDRVVDAWLKFTADSRPGQSFHIECRFLHPDESVVTVCGEAIGLYDDAGRLTEFLGTVVDISSQKRAHQELIRLADAAETARKQVSEQAEVLSEQAWNLICARERAETASHAKSEFLANISHEIRTPLNAILGMTDLVLDGNLAEDHREMLGTVHSSGEHLLQLINDVLDFSKIEAGKLTLNTSDFNTEDCIEQAVGMFKLPASQQGLMLTCTLADSLPEWLHGDAGRLRQILVNLVGNAVKFTTTGSISVTAEVAEVQDSAIAIHLSVTDTGIGIPREKLAAIFKPFEQADGSTTRRFGGTGLGLSIVGRLVQMMKGRIWVESEVGEGSTFHCIVQLQAARHEVPLQTDAEPPRELRAAPLSSSPKLRILLAEDNAVNQALMIRLLERDGHQVAAVADGEKAVVMAERLPFDLVLMDVQMPVMSGIEAAAAIRKHERITGRSRLPIVALTASTLVSDRQACEAAGMDSYITKPVRRELLNAEIERIQKLACARVKPEASGAESLPESLNDTMVIPASFLSDAINTLQAEVVSAPAVNPPNAVIPAPIAEQSPAVISANAGIQRHGEDAVLDTRVRGNDGARLRKPVINSDRVLRNANHSLELLSELIDTFAEHAPAWQNEMQSEAARGDVQSVGRLAHKLRGSAVIFGESPLVTSLEELESSARGSAGIIATPALSRVDAELTDLLEDLRGVLERQAVAKPTEAKVT